MSDVTHTTLRAVNNPTHRLGLALSYGRDAVPVLKAALRRDRERLIFAGGPSLAFFGGSVRRG